MNFSIPTKFSGLTAISPNSEKLAVVQGINLNVKK
jgi:hypothetical protein